MPNIRLKNGYKWTTDGIYDTTQTKTQAAINADIAEVAENNENLILLQNTQPTETGNKIWIKEGISYTVPTVQDMTDAIAVETTAREAADTELRGAITSEATARENADSALQGAINKEILYFQNQAVSAATSAQIMRIPSSGTDSKITTDTVVLECVWANPSAITTDVTWTSYAGYIAFTGTCTATTTANVVLGTKNN